jgi:hypothetical protein
MIQTILNFAKNNSKILKRIGYGTIIKTIDSFLPFIFKLSFIGTAASGSVHQSGA